MGYMGDLTMKLVNSIFCLVKGDYRLNQVPCKTIADGFL